ncbi:MAG: type II toxin-antitoxin system VapC family toxin [Acidimicrobiia bacterium]|jgi:predicted nucleic acid-binding protein|nr:type II toxin-antitoxin system VapC family toxin [Acidimicrobiia bacterium]MBP8180078.1 type II toxin-antitoxin system VapC family toxin [Acidimicrobiia bacterium]
MIVLDASVVVNLVGDDGAAGDTAREVARSSQNRIAVPDLVDVESVAVLRRRWLNNGLTAERFRLAVEDLTALPFQRFPAAPLMRRAYELRNNATPSDACYVALAEALLATLVTADARLANAPGINCSIQLIRTP